MRSLLRVLLSLAFVTTGWIAAPAASSRACCPCEPAPGCCVVSAPGSHALPVATPHEAAAHPMEAPAWTGSASQGREAWAPMETAQVLGRKPTRAWLGVWRI